MRADSRPPHPEFPWAAVIRMGMETWRPERLPARFQPRPRRRVGVAPRPAWRLVAAGVGALVLVGIALARPTP